MNFIFKMLSKKKEKKIWGWGIFPGERNLGEGNTISKKSLKTAGDLPPPFLFNQAYKKKNPYPHTRLFSRKK